MNAHKLDNITPTMANEIVQSRYHRTTSLGCWESGKKPHHGGYAVVTVRAGEKVISPGLHQMALIASGRHDELRQTLHGHSYDVSHLCHNRKCFNSDHLVVESRQNNRNRQACNGHKILVGAGFSYHPCAHGSVEKMRKCILPVQHLHVTMPNCASTEETPVPDLVDTATSNNDADANKFDHITPAMAQQLINTYRAVTTDLGCWESNLNRDKRGYVPVHRRNLLSKGRIHMHQLALIATDRGAELKTTLGNTSFNVSHLCHNGICFNPDHLVVESERNNFKRRTCVGHKVILYGDSEHHPCRHDEVETMRKCILPLLRLEAGDHVNGSV
ncbi:zinc-binding loop region of homing endonuclease-domain-containing protein [Lipomyces tetrasporus]|uniref:Zinc-binding loop region of homing endonuclease-domain-containing protein n=1 Tax=Lipomyces tetrasporus TaxID=54092 RepID=A0AAD7QK31_9ASCO|nr:zinc-binding loop region of homing endonuclease-domain-containing protein [Lipomyces tetrasporus]KAJ8096646.1 zinc-binding loop region of homing endonuclease-domain-containing protein [Lipomyces tetrasporus]